MSGSVLFISTADKEVMLYSLFILTLHFANARLHITCEYEYIDENISKT